MIDRRYICFSGKWLVILSLILMSAAIVVCRLHTYNEPQERDLTTYAVIAHEMFAGRRLYSDMWDHKPPAIHLTFALAESLVGYGPQSIYLLNVTGGIIGLFGVYAAAAVVFGPRCGLLAALFWTIFSGDLDTYANQPNTELFINCLSIWTFVLLLRATKQNLAIKQFLLVGILTALASMYKHIAFMLTAGMWVPSAIYRLCKRISGPKRLLVEAAIMLLCGALAWLGLVAYYWLTGTFVDFRIAVFDYNKFYAGDMVHNVLRPFIDCLDCLTKFFWLPQTLPLLITSVIGCIYGLCVRQRFPWLLWIGYAAGVFIAVGSPGRYWMHYFQLWIPVLCVGSAWSIACFNDIMSLAGSKLRPLSGYVKGSAKLQTKFPAWRPPFPLIFGTCLAVLVLVAEKPFYLFPPSQWVEQQSGNCFVDRLQTPVVEDPWQKDLTTYIVTGDMLQTKTPIYADLFDRRPPAIHLTYVIAAVASIVGIYEAAGTIFGPSGALWAAVLWLIAAFDLTLQDPQLTAEPFINCFNIWTFAWLLRATKEQVRIARLGAVGLLSGLASLFQQSTLCVAAFTWFASAAYRLRHHTSDKKRLVLEGCLLFGVCLAVWTSLAVYLLMCGASQNFVAVLADYDIAHLPDMVRNFFRPISEPGCLMMFFCLPQIWPLLVTALIGCLGSLRKQNRYAWFLWLAYGAGVQVAIGAPGRYYLHSFQLWLPVICIGAGWAITDITNLQLMPARCREFCRELACDVARLTRPVMTMTVAPGKQLLKSLTSGASIAGEKLKISSAWWSPFAAALVTVLLLIVEVPFYQMPADDWSNRKYGNIFSEDVKIAAQINRLLLPDETFYQFGNETELYFYSRKHPPVGATYTYPVCWAPRQIEQVLAARIISQLAERKPELIVVWPEDRKGADASPVVKWCFRNYVQMPVCGDYTDYFLIRKGGRLQQRLALKNARS